MVMWQSCGGHVMIMWWSCNIHEVVDVKYSWVVLTSFHVANNCSIWRFDRWGQTSYAAVTYLLRGSSSTQFNYMNCHSNEPPQYHWCEVAMSSMLHKPKTCSALGCSWSNTWQYLMNKSKAHSRSFTLKMGLAVIVRNNRIHSKSTSWFELLSKRLLKQWTNCERGRGREEGPGTEQ